MAACGLRLWLGREGALLDARLAAAGFSGMEGYLVSGVWAGFVGRYLADGGTLRLCVVCDGAGVVLRHRTWVRVPGGELFSDVVPVCGACWGELVGLASRRRGVGVYALAMEVRAGRGGERVDVGYFRAPTPPAGLRGRALGLWWRDYHRSRGRGRRSA